MKVLNIIEDGRLAGPQVRIAGVGQRLKAMGVETVVALPRGDNARFKTLLEQKGVEYVEMSLHPVGRSPKRMALFLLLLPVELWNLYRLMRRGGFDVVHCSGGWWQFKGVVAAWLARVPALWHLNDTWIPGFVKPAFGFMLHRMAAGVVVAAERVRAYYAERVGFGKLPVFEIQAPVDGERFDPETVRPDTQMTADGPVVMTVGNVNPFKGVEYFVRMAAEVRRQRPDVRFRVVGPLMDSQAAYIDSLRREAAQLGLAAAPDQSGDGDAAGKTSVDHAGTTAAVTSGAGPHSAAPADGQSSGTASSEKDVLSFTGPCDDVPAALAAADVYVCSSTHEASPISVWEAMSMARPIVSTDVGDVARFLKDGVCGRVVEPQDASALAAAVLELLEDKERAAALGQQARRAALRHLDLEAVARAHADAYAAVGRS